MWKYSSVFLFLASCVCMAQSHSSSAEKYDHKYYNKYDKKCCTQGHDCRVYTFAMTNIPAFATLEDGVISGPGVDIVNEVCAYGHKACEVALVEFNNCWGVNGRSEVLDGQWYDYCALADSGFRGAAFNFIKFGLGVLAKPLVITKNLENDTLEKLMENDPNRTLAWMSNPNLLTKDSLDLFFDDGYKVDSGNIMAVDDIDPIAAVAKIIDMVNQGLVEFGIIVAQAISSDALPFEVVVELSKKLEGDGDGSMTLMIRKDEPCLKHWWDTANLGFRCSKKGKKFCDDLATKYGNRAEYCFPETECPEKTKSSESSESSDSSDSSEEH